MDFEYINSNVPGEGADLEDFEVFLEGCQCAEKCSHDSCPHLKYGLHYDDLSRLSAEAMDGHPIVECGVLCKCSELCGNRVVQKGISLKLEVFRTDKKGFGMKTLEDIPSRTFVSEYIGEIIGEREANRRRQARIEANLKENYIFSIKEQTVSNLKITVIDASQKGNLSRFINHSCTPNLDIVLVRYDTPLPRLALFANRDINKNEELSYSYGSLENDVHNGPLTCYCGSQHCFGYLPTCE